MANIVVNRWRMPTERCDRLRGWEEFLSQSQLVQGGYKPMRSLIAMTVYTVMEISEISLDRSDYVVMASGQY